MFAATAVTALVSLAVSALLLRSPSPRTRGLGLSLAASAVVVVIGATIYACLILR
jgi:hypothetical protein